MHSLKRTRVAFFCCLHCTSHASCELAETIHTSPLQLQSPFLSSSQIHWTIFYLKNPVFFYYYYFVLFLFFKPNLRTAAPASHQFLEVRNFCSTGYP